MTPRVWIVNADHWPRAYLRAELIERGYDATGFEDLQDVVIRLGLRAPRPELLVVEAPTGEIPMGLRQFLAAQNVPVLAVVAAGAERRALDLDIEPLRRPLTIGAIADAVERRVPRGRSEATPEPGR
jgi:DNA-binding response OmpR family regulator